MKGTLHKTETGWVVRYRETTPLSITTETLPLHRDDISDILSNPDSKIENLVGKEVEFEIVNKLWGVNDDVIPYAKLIKPNVDKVVENDIYEMAQEYAIKSHSPNREARRKGFVDGYNKAKETLYTEEQIRKAYYQGAADVHDKCTDRTWRGVETKVDIELLKKLNAEYIQSLKQPKKD